DLNNNSNVHGILVQLPLPHHIKEQSVIEAIDPKKDVDGFHPVNIGRMMTNQETFLPCTPYGILTMLKSCHIDLEGKHAVIIGRSNIVGKPVGQMLLNENATVTYGHSRTKYLKTYTTKADDIKQGEIDMGGGINRLEDGTLTGDVDFSRVKQKASYITPVPHGVGPMTITMLRQNTIQTGKGLTASEG